MKTLTNESSSPSMDSLLSLDNLFLEWNYWIIISFYILQRFYFVINVVSVCVGNSFSSGFVFLLAFFVRCLPTILEV